MADPLPLTAVAYDRAAERRADAAWLEAAWTRARVVLVSPEATTPAAGDALATVTAAEVPEHAPRRFLGVAGDLPYFSATVPAAEGWADLRSVGVAVDNLDAGLLTSAVALQLWHGRHPRCPLCGAETAETLAGWTRTCPQDGSQHFPRTDPAVIMVVHDGGDRCLLGRGPQWQVGRLSTLAGFVEPGESLEAAVMREVHEEVGVDVGDVHYVASQPWPFPSSLMVGFTARAVGDTTITIDEDEIAQAQWFTRDEVRRAGEWTDEGVAGDSGATLLRIPPVLSISRFLIDRWLAGEI